MRVLAIAKQNENGLFISNIIGREMIAPFSVAAPPPPSSTATSLRLEQAIKAIRLMLITLCFVPDR